MPLSEPIGILLNEPIGTNFIEIVVEIQTFSFEKMHLKTSSAKWRPFCHGLNVLICQHPLNNILVVSVSYVRERKQNPARRYSS